MIWMYDGSSGLILSCESNALRGDYVEKFAQVVAEKHPNNIYFVAELVGPDREGYIW